MYRALQVNTGKVCNAMLTADAAMVVGMGVVEKDGEACFPTAVTGENIYFVRKGISTTSIDEVEGELSDYSDAKTTIAEGELVAVEPMVASERYFIDQISGTIAKGDYLMLNTDGKFKKAVATNVSTILVVDAAATDAGHAGAIVKIVAPHTI